MSAALVTLGEGSLSPAYPTRSGQALKTSASVSTSGLRTLCQSNIRRAESTVHILEPRHVQLLNLPQVEYM